MRSSAVVEYFWYTAWPDGQNRYNATEQAVRAAGMTLRPRGITDIAQLDGTFVAIKETGARTVVVQPSPFTYGQRGAIIASAAKNGLGTIFAFPVAAREGSLIAYGPDYLHMYRRAPLYVSGYSRASSPLIYPLNSPARLNCLSIRRPPRRSELSCRCPCSFAPTS